MNEQLSAIIDKLTSTQVFWIVLIYVIYRIIIDTGNTVYRRKVSHKHKIKANLQLYNELTRRMFSKIRDNARAYCRKNGFDKLPHRKFKDQIKEFSNECMDLGLQVMEEHYDNDIMIIPFHVAGANLDRTEVYLDVLEIMDEVRDISIKAKDKMCDLQKERIAMQNELTPDDTNEIVNLVINYVTQVMEVKNSILRDQMTLIERKLELMRIKIYVSFRERVKGKKAPSNNFGKWVEFKEILK